MTRFASGLSPARAKAPKRPWRWRREADGSLRLAVIAALAVLGLQSAPRAAELDGSAPTVLRSPQSVGFDPQRLKRLDAAMAEAVAQGRVAGLTMLLARHGKIVEFNAYGKADMETGRPMSKDAIFRIYSMSKPLTGVAMMILFEEGKWRLDDPVTKYIPEFKTLRVMTGVGPDGRILTEDMKRPPTMRELMSHTAGFGYGLGDTHPVDKLYRQKGVLASRSLKEMIERTAEIPLMFQPGANWSYSSAVDIQGYIIEKLSGETLGAFLNEHLFKPLKMNDTAFYVRPGQEGRLAVNYVADPKTGVLHEAKELFGNPMPDYTRPPLMESGGGGLTSTTDDYARFCQMMLNKGELDGVRILAPATIELMDTNVIPHDVLVSSNGTTASRFNDAVGFGLDFMVVNDPRRAGSLVGKNTMSWGGAAGTWFWIDPANDVLFVGMVQRMGGTGDPDLSGLAQTLTYQALTHPEK